MPGREFHYEPGDDPMFRGAGRLVWPEDVAPMVEHEALRDGLGGDQAVAALERVVQDPEKAAKLKELGALVHGGTDVQA